MYSVSVIWYGQPGFRRTAGDSPILIDPFLTDQGDRCYPPPATATEFADVALVLCTPEPGSASTTPGRPAVPRTAHNTVRAGPRRADAPDQRPLPIVAVDLRTSAP
jgi:hypothetical protein